MSNPLMLPEPNELRFSPRLLGVHERAILDRVEEQGLVTMADVMAATGALRESVRKRLGQLVKKGFLMPQGKGRAAAYRKA
ncbi:MAG: DUF977 family protein [Akkermansiaceae bacterium]|nr:DUF977 family protein [Akkermansiaceae bacterium]